MYQLLATFLGLNPKGPYLNLEKERENFCLVFTYSIKRAREMRTFHVAVVQRRLRNCAKKRDTRAHLLFCKLTPIGFHFSCCPRLCCCLRCLLLWSRHFATIVTWRHTPPLYRYWILYCAPLAFLSFFPPSISSLPSSLIIYFFLTHSFLSSFHSFSLAGCKNEFSFKFCRRMRKYCGHGDKNGRYMRSKCRFSCGCV